jgi:hypothetical protein
MLADINYIVYTIPTLGPVLGPIVYDVKCLLEYVRRALLLRVTDSLAALSSTVPRT